MLLSYKTYENTYTKRNTEKRKKRWTLDTRPTSYNRVQSLLQCKNLARSVECTAHLKATSDETSVLAVSEFHIVKILHDKNFLPILQEFYGLYSL